MKLSFRQRISHVLLNPAWICFTWFGMTAGISMLATPARFAAATITRPIALDVGRVVFSVLNKAEFIFLILLLLIVRLSNRSRAWWGVCAVLALILIAQSAWLLPELSARTDMIIAGSEPPPSFAHGTYSTLEIIKLTLLLYLGVDTLSAAQHSGTRARP